MYAQTFKPSVIFFQKTSEGSIKSYRHHSIHNDKHTVVRATIYERRTVDKKAYEQNGDLIKLKDAELSLQLPIRVVPAVSDAEIMGACSLRSHVFLAYPLGRSESAKQLHRTMRTKEEFAILQRKLSGTEPGFPRVVCLVALCDENDLPYPSLDLNPTHKVPKKGGSGFEWVVGTLDVNLGSKLPGEELIGLLPKGEEAESRRAYLSNVCVATSARRKDVGKILIENAESVAFSWGVEHLYIHVIVDNFPAKYLYLKCGFQVEQEESAAMARLLNRPRRLLLNKPCSHDLT